jgi:tRNA(Ile)-lysidine synthase
MTSPPLASALQSVPSGQWAVGVSGGADSVGLFHLLRDTRPDLHLVVAHLNHQTRGDENEADAAFVRDLCARAKVTCHVAQRDQIEREIELLPANTSAKFRALRFALFRRVVESDRLNGVLLAHHADDQAETVFQRLSRGGGFTTLAGIARRTTVNGVPVLRPLLAVRRATLRAYLTERGLCWREDSSNRSPKYLRNRIRELLREREDLTDALLELVRTCAALKRFVRRASPRLKESFAIGTLDDLPALLARESARRWLRDHRVPAGSIDRAAIERMRAMCADAASAHRQQFPGGVFVRRQRGIISAE